MAPSSGFHGRYVHCDVDGIVAQDGVEKSYPSTRSKLEPKRIQSVAPEPMKRATARP